MFQSKVSKCQCSVYVFGSLLEDLQSVDQRLSSSAISFDEADLLPHPTQKHHETSTPM